MAVWSSIGDPAKHEKTRQERGFGFDYAIRIFAGPTVEAIDRRQAYGEERIRAIGEIDGRVFVVVTPIVPEFAGSSVHGRRVERISGHGEAENDAGGEHGP